MIEHASTLCFLAKHFAVKLLIFYDWDISWVVILYFWEVHGPFNLVNSQALEVDIPCEI